MESKKSTPAPQQAHSVEDATRLLKQTISVEDSILLKQAHNVEESVTSLLKQAHSNLMDVLAEIYKADALLTTASKGTLNLDELNKVSRYLRHLLSSMISSLSAASYFSKNAVKTTNMALRESQHQVKKRRYEKPVVVAVRGDK